MLVCRIDSRTNYEKKDTNLEEEESSNDEIVKTKQSRKKSNTKKAGLKQEQEVQDDDHGKILTIVEQCLRCYLELACLKVSPISDKNVISLACIWSFCAVF